ncbi:MAG: hypothetical protein HC910_22235 [Spirulinaceae cyanobacterium SM2_1_0]|nr:hypothetical protein [Spirulinaceae cyanobacterium SM2_1_0]
MTESRWVTDNGGDRGSHANPRDRIMHIPDRLLRELRLYLSARQQQQDAEARRLLIEIDELTEAAQVEAALTEPGMIALFASVPSEEALHC